MQSDCTVNFLVALSMEKKYDNLINETQVIAELHSGLKGRRAELHRFHTNIENWKTMRLGFHGHRGKRHGSRARALYIRANEVAQNGGHTPEKSLT